tara:strand:+ start:389 stop:841 length:453 start_codon:yes stop_codon:yes gene_type:complete
MAEHYKLKTNTHSSCVIGTPENDAHRDALGCSPRNHIFVWLPPSECEGHCFAWIHKDNLGEMIPKEDFHQHRADWLVEKVNKLKEELEESEKENKKLKEDKRLLLWFSNKMIDHIAEHPEDAVAREGFASEAEFLAWKKKAMAECLPIGY